VQRGCFSKIETDELLVKRRLLRLLRRLLIIMGNGRQGLRGLRCGDGSGIVHFSGLRCFHYWLRLVSLSWAEAVCA